MLVLKISTNTNYFYFIFISYNCKFNFLYRLIYIFLLYIDSYIFLLFVLYIFLLFVDYDNFQICYFIDIHSFDMFLKCFHIFIFPWNWHFQTLLTQLYGKTIWYLTTVHLLLNKFLNLSVPLHYGSIYPYYLWKKEMALFYSIEC